MRGFVFFDKVCGPSGPVSIALCFESRRGVGREQEITTDNFVTDLHGITGFASHVLGDRQAHFSGAGSTTIKWNLECHRDTSFRQCLTERKCRSSIADRSIEICKQNGDSRFVPINTEPSSMVLQDGTIDSLRTVCDGKRGVVPQGLLVGALAHEPAQFGIDDQGANCRVPFVAGPGKEAVEAGRDARLVDPSRRCDTWNFHKCRFVVFQVALAFRERVDDQGNEVDIHPRDLRGKAAPIDEWALFHAVSKLGELRELDEVEISGNGEKKVRKFVEQAN